MTAQYPVFAHNSKKTSGSSVNSAFSVFLKIVVSGAILVFLLSRIRLAPIIAVLKAYPVSSLAAPLALYILFGFWASFKWKILLPGIRFQPVIRVSFSRYFYAMIALGTVTGDVARAYLLGKQNKKHAAIVTASVIVDRVTGFIGLAVTGIAGILTSSMHIPPAVPIVCLAALGLCLLAMVSLRSISCYAFVMNFIRSAPRLFPPLRPAAAALERGFGALHIFVGQGKLMVWSVAAAVVSQIICVAAIALLAQGLGLTVAYGDWCWIFCIVSLTVLVPVTISGLGIREGSFVALLSLASVGAEKAMALSLLVFCLDIVLGIIGLACLWRRQPQAGI